MNVLAECELDPGACTWRGVDGERGADDTSPFLDNGRPNASLVQFVSREPPFELEPHSVILDDKTARSTVRRQSDQDVSGVAVPPDVG